MQDTDAEFAEALKELNLEMEELTEKERRLLEFARLLTETPWQTTDEDVHRLRRAGWTDPEMSEAVYIVSLFAFFNRVADAFGLVEQDFNDQLQPSSAD